MTTTTYGWSLQNLKRAGGRVYRQLVKIGKDETGKRTTLASIALSSEGRDVTEPEALAALHAMRRLAARGDEAKILTAYNQASHSEPGKTGLYPLPQGRGMIVALLVGDVNVDEYLASLSPDAPQVEPKDMTVTDYWTDLYWPARTGQVPDPATKIGADETVDKELRVWRLIHDSPLGRTRLRDLDAWVFQQYLDGLVCRPNPARRKQHENLGKSVSPRTKAIHRSTYQAMLNFAFRKGHVRHKHDFFPIFGVASKGTQTPKEDPLSIDEVSALFGTETDPMRRCMWAVAIGMGLRPSELTRVRWDDVKDNGTMAVRGSKTELSKAVVPMTPLARAEVDRYRAHLVSEGMKPDGLLFHLCHKPIKDYGHALEGSCRKAGITRRVYPYLLRATFATLAYLMGVDKDTTRAIGRWTDTKMLDEVYCRPRPADLVEKVQAFALPTPVGSNMGTVAAPAPTTIETTEVTEDHWLRLMGG